MRVLTEVFWPPVFHWPLTVFSQSKDVEMAELKAKSSSVHADTNTDLHRHDQQTNTDYAPTAITGYPINRFPLRYLLFTASYFIEISTELVLTL